MDDCIFHSGHGSNFNILTGYARTTTKSSGSSLSTTDIERHQLWSFEHFRICIARRLGSSSPGITTRRLSVLGMRKRNHIPLQHMYKEQQLVKTGRRSNHRAELSALNLHNIVPLWDLMVKYAIFWTIEWQFALLAAIGIYEI